MRRIAGLMVLLSSAGALAAEPVVPVQAEVVHASTQAGQVAPSLAKMQNALASRVKYLSMKVLSTQRLELSATASKLTLANQKVAELRLAQLKDGVATVHVKVPPADATYTLAKDKALYLQAGAHDGGDLWLVLSEPK